MTAENTEPFDLGEYIGTIVANIHSLKVTNKIAALNSMSCCDDGVVKIFLNEKCEPTCHNTACCIITLRVEPAIKTYG